MRAAQVLDETVRYLSLRLVLAPAAYLLPRSWALWLADALPVLLLVFPHTGTGLYWQMREVFGRGRLDSLKLALGWLGRGYRDFIINKRVVIGREDLFRWRIVERNADRIEALRRSGESYIVACGHFGVASGCAMLSPAVTWGHAVQVFGQLPARSWNIRALRLRYQAETFTIACCTAWRRRCELISSGPDDPGIETIYERLRERGNAVFIAVDMLGRRQTKTGSYERPFQGLASRSFDLGAARLARLTGAPILSCVHWVEDDGTIVIEWGTPIRADEAAVLGEIGVMDAMLDRLEISIGDRPTHYAFEIGAARRWDPLARQWTKR